jgi:nucleoside-diphosphate-sugar epimerase
MPVASMKKILVTGATGQIGSELTIELRKKYGNDGVIAAGHRRKPSEKLFNSGPFEYVDVTDEERITKVVKKYDINTIYHLAAVLSAAGEEKPQLAWKVNMGGLYSILETARKNELVRIFWPSSIAVFGPGAPRINTPQDTILAPRTIYGVTKVAGELLCNYYFIKFGLDVRSVRYPGIISSETPPGGGITDYAIEMFFEAIRKKRYTCFVTEDTILPVMYMPDCIKAAIDLMDAELSEVKRCVSYNVTGVSLSAGMLAAEIKKHIPGFECEYKPDSRQKIADSWPMSIDDSVAGKEWGWRSTYDLGLMTRDMIDKITKRFPETSETQPFI